MPGSLQRLAETAQLVVEIGKGLLETIVVFIQSLEFLVQLRGRVFSQNAITPIEEPLTWFGAVRR